MSPGLSDFVLPNIRSMEGYTPGEQFNDPDIIKLNTNENPFPVTQKVLSALNDEIQKNRLHLYPNPTSQSLRKAIAEKYGRSERCVLIGNGSDDILTIVFRTFLNFETAFVIPWPTYSLYPVLSSICGAACEKITLKDDWHMDFSRMNISIKDKSASIKKMTIFANPNAPTGVFEKRDDVLSFAKGNPGLTLVDEAYIAFGGESVMYDAGTDDYSRLMTCGTLSKSHSLAGQRIGWLIAHEDLICELDKVRDSYNLSRLAQVAGLAAILDEEEYRKRFNMIIENRNFLASELKKRGFSFPESHTNFLFVRPPDGTHHLNNTAKEYYEFLKRNKILIRYFFGDKTGNHVRITIGNKEQLEKLLGVTDIFLKEIIPG
jgi:histidinol-phosphate aminotransferase